MGIFDDTRASISRGTAAAERTAKLLALKNELVTAGTGRALRSMRSLAHWMTISSSAMKGVSRSHILAVTIFLLLVLVFTGCSQASSVDDFDSSSSHETAEGNTPSNSPDNAQESEFSSSNDVAESNTYNTKAPRAFSLSDVQDSKDDFFVNSGDSYYKLDFMWKKYSEEKINGSYIYSFFPPISGFGEPISDKGLEEAGRSTSLKLSEGESLLTTSSGENIFAGKIVQEGYTVAPSFSLMGFDEDTEIEGTPLGETPSGVTYEGIVEILQSKGYDAHSDGFFEIESPQPLSFEIGTYSGAKFETGESHYVPFCLCDGGSKYDIHTFGFTQLEVERTKDGYSIVDTSLLTPGEWLIGKGANTGFTGSMICAKLTIE